MNELYKVYARVDGANRILALNSSAFLRDLADWVEIDEGHGDRYRHAQNRYLNPLMTEEGIPLYKLADGAVMRRTQAEIETETPDTPLSTAQRLAALEAAGLERDLALMELAAMMTGGM